MIASRTTLVSRLPQIISRTSAGVPELVEQTAEAIADGLEDVAPRGASGLLARTAEARRHGPTEWGVYLRFYWIFHEFGTVHMPARPFVFPTADAAGEPFRRALGRLWW